MKTPDAIIEEITVGPEQEKLRLDRLLAAAFQDYSRSFLQKAIRDGQVTLDGAQRKPNYRVSPGEHIRVVLPILVPDRLEPEAIPLDILYEDSEMLAVNKPPDMVVHPTRGRAHGTLANAILHHCKMNLSDVNGPLRPGIVHRLDRDTSGVILCAKTNAAHARLAEQFKQRLTQKEYLAVVRGRMEYDSGEVNLPISRDPRLRAKMCARPISEGKPGRTALTVYHVTERFRRFTITRVLPRTGRTHQIRVHMSTMGHPIVADALYGGGDALYEWELTGSAATGENTPIIARQALHARSIRFTHPTTGESMSLQAEPPEDIQRLIAMLRKEG